MTTDPTLTQLKLSLLASIVARADQTASESVKAAMSIWVAAGEELNPASKAPVAMSLDNLLKTIIPEEIKAKRKPKYRKFLTWLEWARWGPDFLHLESLPNQGGMVEIEVDAHFIERQVGEKLECQGKEGVLDSLKIIREYEFYLLNNALNRSVKATNAANAKHAKTQGVKKVGPKKVAPKKVASTGLHASATVSSKTWRSATAKRARR